MLLKDYKLISPAIYADVRATLAKHGFEVTKSSASVDEMLGEIKLSFVAHDTRMNETPEQIRWKQYARVLYGLNPEWLGQTLKFGNGPAEIGGLLNTRSEKCVLLLQDGKRRICTPDQAIRVAKLSGLAAAEPVRATPATDLIK
jgi:hypothetical protein